MDRICRKALICLLVITGPAYGLQAQDTADPAHHDHHHKHHEIALGSGAVFLPHEELWGLGVHLHGLLAINSWMSAGAGYELIAGEHRHHTLSALVHLHPIHPLDINLGPGLVFPDEENPGFRFKAHLEVAAAFEVGRHFHLGPSIDVGAGKHDLHITPGIHLGWIIPAGE